MRPRDNQRERAYRAEKSHSLWRPISIWITWEQHESNVRKVEKWHRDGRLIKTVSALPVSRPEPELRPMTLAKARKYAISKAKSAWWRKEFKGRGTIIDVVDARRDSSASCHRWGYDVATIKLPKWSRWPLTILHELAHAVTAPRYAWHGPEFALNFLKLVSHYIGVEEAKELKTVFKQNGVNYRRRPNDAY